MCYRRVPYATYENSEEAVAERNDAYLATKALLVDDTVILWLLSRTGAVCLMLKLRDNVLIVRAFSRIDERRGPRARLCRGRWRDGG